MALTPRQLGSALEDVAVKVRDQSASGTIDIDGEQVGHYCITEVRQEVRGWSGVSGESIADQFLDDMDQEMSPDD
jgi:hypothetical protein